jgi:hypothetical protein
VFIYCHRDFLTVARMAHSVWQRTTDRAPAGLIPGRGKRFFSSPQRPDRLWDPPSLLSNGYRGQSGRIVKLTDLHLVLKSRIVKLYIHTSLWRGTQLNKHKYNFTYIETS